MLRDIISTSLIRNISFLFKLAMSVVVARLFGPEGKGLVVALFLVPESIAMLGSCSVEEASLYWLAKKRISKARMKKVFINIVLIQVPLLVFTGAVYFDLVDYSYTMTELTLCLSLVPVYLLLETGRFSLRGLHEIRAYNQSILIETVIPLFFIVVLLIQKDVWWFIVGQSAGLVMALVYVWVRFLSEFREYVVEGEPVDNSFDVYVYGLKVHVFKVLNTLDAKIAALVISIVLPLSELGIYSVAVTFSLLLQMGLQLPISTVILPRLACISESARVAIVGTATRGMFFMSILFLLVLVLFGKWLLVLVFGKSFEAAYWAMVVLVIGKILKTPSATLNCYFKSKGMPEKIAAISMKAAPISILLSIVLIPLYGVMGAAFATVAANIVFGYFVISQYQKETGGQLVDIFLLKRSDIGLVVEKLKNFRERVVR